MAQIITSAEARQFIPKLTSGEDALLTALIDAVDAAFAFWLGYPEQTTTGSATITPTVYTEFLDGPDAVHADLLRLGRWPLTAVTTIHDDPERVYGATTLVAATDYELDGRHGLVILTTSSVQGAWSTSYRAIKAVYTAGHAIATMPTDIKLAARLAVSHYFRLRHQAGHSSISQQGGSTSIRPETLPDSVRELLKPWRMGVAAAGLAVG